MLGFYNKALTLLLKFEFHQSLEVTGCCLGSPGKSGEKFVLKVKLHSCLHSIQECFSWQTKSSIHDSNNIINEWIYSNIYTSLLHLTTSPPAITSAETSDTKCIKLDFQKPQYWIWLSCWNKTKNLARLLEAHISARLKTRLHYLCAEPSFRVTLLKKMMVRSASWLKLKGSTCWKCCEENFIWNRLRKSCTRVE